MCLNSLNLLFSLNIYILNWLKITHLILIYNNIFQLSSVYLANLNGMSGRVFSGRAQSWVGTREKERARRGITLSGRLTVNVLVFWERLGPIQQKSVFIIFFNDRKSCHNTQSFGLSVHKCKYSLDFILIFLKVGTPAGYIFSWLKVISHMSN